MERTLLLNARPKKYDEAFKAKAVDMVLQGGKTVREVAEDIGVSHYSIYQWKKKFLPLSAVPGLLGKPSGFGRIASGCRKTPEAGRDALIRELHRAASCFGS